MAPASGSAVQAVESRETLRCVDTLIKMDPEGTEKFLLDDPVVVVTVFRQFPWFAQQIVLRLLFITACPGGEDFHGPGGKPPGGDAGAPDPVGPTFEDLKNWMVSQGAHHKEAAQLLKEAVDVLQAVGWLHLSGDGEASDKSKVVLKPTVQKRLQGCLGNKPVTKLICAKPANEDVTYDTLIQHAIKKWDTFLNYMVGPPVGTDTPPSAEVESFLKNIDFIGPKAKSSGLQFSFVMQNRQKQIWSLFATHFRKYRSKCLGGSHPDGSDKFDFRRSCALTRFLLNLENVDAGQELSLDGTDFEFNTEKNRSKQKKYIKVDGIRKEVVTDSKKSSGNKLFHFNDKFIVLC